MEVRIFIIVLMNRMTSFAESPTAEGLHLCHSVPRTSKQDSNLAFR